MNDDPCAVQQERLRKATRGPWFSLVLDFRAINEPIPLNEDVKPILWTPEMDELDKAAEAHNEVIQKEYVGQREPHLMNARAATSRRKSRLIRRLLI